MSHEKIRMARLSIAAAVVTFGLKIGAWALTGSVGLFSDAAESLVNFAAAVIALAAITLALRPADDDHAYGHDKVEYFSSGAEGSLILVAAVAIIYEASQRLLHPEVLENLGPGLLVSLVASAINFSVAMAMLRTARRYDSITLEADAKHLLTDVWTSAGVVGGLMVVWFAPPSWQILDPLIAIAVGINIVATGVALLRRSWRGLMDASLAEEELAVIRREVSARLPDGTSFHDLRTRKSGPRRFIDFHLLVPGLTTVRDAHALCDRLEAGLEAALAHVSITIHVEPEETHGDT